MSAEEEYAKISHEYVKSKQHIWRKHVEEYSIREILGSAENLNVLELACGAGHYSNKLLNEWRIAGTLLATDISPEMIALAKATYPEINFAVADACGTSLVGNNDLVFAAYLINYCSNYPMLLSMCQTIKQNLLPEGKFISVNDGIRQDEKTYPQVAGLKKSLHQPERKDFSPFTVLLSDTENGSDKGCEFTNYWISEETIKSAFRQVGFRQVEILPVKKSCQDTICNDFLEKEVICLIYAVK